jgi:phage baseplate assembly protein gpV
MIKFGFISEIFPDEGRVRVEFKEDGITSGKLPVLVAGSKGNKHFHTFDIGEHVACHMDEHCENGYVAGAIYNDKDKPSVQGKDVWGVKFKDGAELKYNTTAKEFTLKIGVSQFVVNEAGGFRIKKGGETLFQILTDLFTQLAAETHTGNLGYPTSPPLNAPAYAAIMARMATLLIP